MEGTSRRSFEPGGGRSRGSEIVSARGARGAASGSGFDDGRRLERLGIDLDGVDEVRADEAIERGAGGEGDLFVAVEEADERRHRGHEPGAGDGLDRRDARRGAHAIEEPAGVVEARDDREADERGVAERAGGGGARRRGGLGTAGEDQRVERTARDDVGILVAERALGDAPEIAVARDAEGPEAERELARVGELAELGELGLVEAAAVSEHVDGDRPPPCDAGAERRRHRARHERVGRELERRRKRLENKGIGGAEAMEDPLGAPERVAPLERAADQRDREIRIGSTEGASIASDSRWASATGPRAAMASSAVTSRRSSERHARQSSPGRGKRWRPSIPISRKHSRAQRRTNASSEIAGGGENANPGGGSAGGGGSGRRSRMRRRLRPRQRRQRAPPRGVGDRGELVERLRIGRRGDRRFGRRGRSAASSDWGRATRG